MIRKRRKTPPEPLELLILYWLGYESGPDHIYLGFFTDHLEAQGSMGYQHLRRDCYLAGVEIPSTEEFLNLLQGLIDDGYAGAEVDEEEPIDDVRHLPADIEPWDVSVYSTMEGLQEYEEFEEEMDEAKGDRSVEFARGHLEEMRRMVSYPAIIPDYILADDAILAEVEAAGDESNLILTYTQGMDPITTTTILQTLGQLPEDESTDKLQSERSQSLGSTQVSLREYQINTNMARIVAEWLKSGVSTRVTLERVHMYDDDDYGAKPTPLSIDTAMRRRILKIVRSCLSTDSP